VSEEGFLSRWSRRKRAAEAGRPVADPQDAAPAPPTPPGATAPAMPPRAAEAATMPRAAEAATMPRAVEPATMPRAVDPATMPGDGTPVVAGLAPTPAADAPAFDPASLPSLDSLTAASDFTAFLRKEVPEALRRAALRKAWSVDPAIRDFVGPADYAWDFNAPDGVPGFALELGGDVKELLAQVFRAAEGDPPGAGAAPADAGPVPGPATVAGAAAPGEAETPAGPAVAAAAPGAPALLPPADTPSAPAAPEAPPVADAPAADPPRRHGSALPA
jgi:hypothetical protein